MSASRPKVAKMSTLEYFEQVSCFNATPAGKGTDLKPVTWRKRKNAWADVDGLFLLFVLRALFFSWFCLRGCFGFCLAKGLFGTLVILWLLKQIQVVFWFVL